MLLTDAFCYAVFMMSATSSCFGQEIQSKEPSTDIKRHIVKREAAVLIESFPLETMGLNKPNVIYKKISKQRHRSPHAKRSEYNGPAKIRGKFGMPKPTRKPYKKYKVKKVNPKYGPPTGKKSSPKPRFERPSNKPKPDYSDRKRKPHRQQAPLPYQVAYGTKSIPEKSLVGFGEPPAYRVEPNYAEPYGNDGEKEFTARPEPGDNNYAYSNKYYHSFMRPDLGVNQQNPVFDEGQDLDFYSDVFKYSEAKPQSYNVFYAKKRPNFLGDIRKLINRPWKAKLHTENNQILVGGQYAEPPARYVSKSKASDEMYIDEEENAGPVTNFYVPEPSATVSSYVNYKNSNMAFSPQNLNDALSILDK